MQKSILLHLTNGGTIALGVDHFIEADRSDNKEFTTVSYDTPFEEGTFDVSETPEEIQRLINDLESEQNEKSN